MITLHNEFKEKQQQNSFPSIYNIASKHMHTYQKVGNE